LIVQIGQIFRAGEVFENNQLLEHRKLAEVVTDHCFSVCEQILNRGRQVLHIFERVAPYAEPSDAGITLEVDASDIILLEVQSGN
jgi:hypothetical protein